MTKPTEPDDEPGGGEALVPDAATGPDGMPDLGGLGSILEQAQAMQQQLLEAQNEVAETVVEGQAGGGVVTVAVTGGYEFRSVTIDPDAVDPDDVEMLQDLVLAALHDAVARVAALQQESLQVGMPDLGDLGGLLGGDTGST